MNRYFRTTVPTLLILLAGITTACQDRGFFMSDQSGRDPTLVQASVRDGEILLPEDEVELTLAEDIEERSGEVPDSLEIEILDPRGESLGVRELQGQELEGPLPPIEVGASWEGMHTLVLRLFSESGALINEKRIRFFAGTSYPSIDLLETYPPEAVPPGGKGIVVPKISADAGSWLRWSSGGEVLATGSYEDFHGGFVWSAPSDTGVYTLRLELFPVPPPEFLDGGYPFSSPVSSEVQFFVSSGAQGIQRELGPANRYRHLLHLNGELGDEGYASAAFAFSSEPPPVVIREGVFGYRFRSGTQLEADTPLLPAGEEGGIAPFTLTFRYLPEGERGNSRLVQVRDGSGSPYFLLGVDGGSRSRPYLSLRGLDGELRPSSAFGREKTREIAVSLIPRQEELEIRWYHNGRHVSTEIKAYDPVPLPSGGTTIIGGEEGFRGVLYELGLYARNESGSPAADTEVFRRFVEDRYSEKELFFADGYEDTVYLREEDGREQQVHADALPVYADEERHLLSLEGTWNRLDIELTLDQLSNDGYMFFESSDGRRVTIGLDGSVREADGSVREAQGSANPERLTLRGEEGRIVFTLKRRDGRLILSGAGGAGGKEIALAGDAVPALGIGRTGGSGDGGGTSPIRVESLLVLRGTDKLAEKEEKEKKASDKIES